MKLPKFSEVGWNREVIRPYVCLDKHRDFLLFQILCVLDTPPFCQALYICVFLPHTYFLALSLKLSPLNLTC